MRSTCAPTRDGEEIALILYTSGTTGTPKGALLSHCMLTWNAINTQISWGLRESDVAPIFAPFFHAGGLNVLTTPLYHLGGTVVLLRDTSPAVVLRAIAAERCTLVFAVPTAFQQMLESPEFATADLTSVRFRIAGGSSCPLPVIQGFAARGVEFRQGYGLTEVGVNCFSLAPEGCAAQSRLRRSSWTAAHGLGYTRDMTITRMDHVSVVVDDLAAALAFFTTLGMTREGEAAVEGPWVDRVNGLENVHVDIVMLRTPDGHGRLELTTFRQPPLVASAPAIAPPNTLGLRSVMFTVDSVDDTVARLRAHGAELLGEVAQYEDLYRLCYLRGPAGIIVALAEEL